MTFRIRKDLGFCAGQSDFEGILSMPEQTSTVSAVSSVFDVFGGVLEVFLGANNGVQTTFNRQVAKQSNSK